MTHPEPHDPTHPTPLLSSSVRLVATPLAPAVSRVFVRHVLTHWALAEHTDTAALIMSELVTNAVKASAEHVVGVQLCAVDASLFVEVWDGADTLPTPKRPDDETEGGRGLLLVDALSKGWSVHPSPVGGKVVRAELPLGWPLERGSPGETYPPPPLPPGSCASPGPEDERAHQALRERLLTTAATVTPAPPG